MGMRRFQFKKNPSVNIEEYVYKSGIVIEKVRGFSSSTEEFTVPPLLRFSLQSLPGKHTCTKLSLFTILLFFFYLGVVPFIGFQQRAAVRKRIFSLSRRK